MQGYDLFMIIILAAAVIWGAWKGLAWQLASLASVVLSYIVALYFRQPLAGFLSRQVELTPPLDVGLSMLILFLGTSLVVWVGFNLVSETIEKVKLKEFDRQVGALLGLAKGILLCTVITLLAVTMVSDTQREMIYKSRSGYYISMLLRRVEAVLPSEVQDRLEPYGNELEKNVVPPRRLSEFSDEFQKAESDGSGDSQEPQIVIPSSYEMEPPALDLRFKRDSFDSARPQKGGFGR